ncbi:MAG: T9SS type A sorting domain-containing protein [Bacteroidia bacterium]|nr:T9SS type A sorting domain-containing protein [Bacteroidia bacterium]
MRGILLFAFWIFIPMKWVAAQTYWWNESVFYEIFVRSFQDSNGDGIGDFNGITSRLDYLNDGNPDTKTDLGIGALWLMPINSSPSYHGYDVTNYKALQQAYGSAADFKNLLNECHKRGIKVVMDLVINHSSDQHPWFVQSAANNTNYRNFYRWESQKPSYLGPWGQTVWYSKNNSNYYALFWSGMPDLNYRHKPVRDSIFDIARFWLDSMGVDGFRLDAAMYLYENGSNLKNQPETIEFWKAFNDSCKALNPQAMTVGEVWSSRNEVNLYNGKLDYCFEFDQAQATLDGINSGDLFNLKTTVKAAYDNYPFLQYGTFLTNHDQNRVMDVFMGNLDKNKVAASLYLTLPGIPYLYYGEEVAMRGSKPDENIRLPMQWTSGAYAGFSTRTPWKDLNSNYVSFNVESLKANPKSIWNHYRKLIQLRNEQAALQRGSYRNLISDKVKAYTFLRQLNGETVLVMVNASSDSLNDITLSLSGSGLNEGSYSLEELLNGGTELKTINSNLVMNTGNLLPYQSKVLKLSQANSLAENKGFKTLPVFPNPAKDWVQIPNTQPGMGKQVIHIYGIDGKLLKSNSVEASGDYLELNLEELPQGIYLLQGETSSGKWRAKVLK